jgi:hypothetical protein
MCRKSCAVTCQCVGSLESSGVRGLPVYGFGQRETVRTFVAACDAFVFLNDAAQKAE